MCVCVKDRVGHWMTSYIAFNFIIYLLTHSFVYLFLSQGLLLKLEFANVDLTSLAGQQTQGRDPPVFIPSGGNTTLCHCATVPGIYRSAGFQALILVQQPHYPLSHLPNPKIGVFHDDRSFEFMVRSFCSIV